MQAFAGPDTDVGKVALGTLGQYLKWMDRGFTSGACGHAGLPEMIKNDELPVLKREEGGHDTVELNLIPAAPLDA